MTTYYKLECIWTNEDENHRCVDTWNDLSEQQLIEHVIEYLDILHHGNVPYMPELEQLRKNFSQFGEADEDLINTEYTRLVNGYAAYMAIMTEIDEYKSDPHCTASSFSVNVDEQTSLSITAYIQDF